MDGIAAAITERTRAVIVNSPHNPTGRIYAPEELRRLAEVLSEASARNGRDIFLVSDEAYSRIVFDDREFRSPTEFYPNSFLVYTYGKQLLTPGQRLGYIALPPQMPEREEMRRALMLAQLAMAGHGVPNAVMQYALADLDPLAVDIKALQRRRDRMVEEMAPPATSSWASLRGPSTCSRSARSRMTSRSRSSSRSGRSSCCRERSSSFPGLSVSR